MAENDASEGPWNLSIGYTRTAAARPKSKWHPPAYLVMSQILALPTAFMFQQAVQEYPGTWRPRSSVLLFWRFALVTMFWHGWSPLDPVKEPRVHRTWTICSRMDIHRTRMNLPSGRLRASRSKI
jgi:hypothetical protein